MANPLASPGEAQACMDILVASGYVMNATEVAHVWPWYWARVPGTFAKTEDDLERLIEIMNTKRPGERAEYYVQEVPNGPWTLIDKR